MESVLALERERLITQPILENTPFPPKQYQRDAQASGSTASNLEVPHVL
jgi:hypothetical protein